MPAIQEGGSGVKARGSKKKRKPASSRSDAAQRRATPSPPAPQRPYSPPATTRSDAASGGRNQMERAERFKETPQYAKSVAVAYKSRPKAEREERQQRVRANARAGAVSREDRIVARVHRIRMKRAPGRLAEAKKRIRAGTATQRHYDIVADLTDRSLLPISGSQVAARLAAARKSPVPRMTKQNREEYERLLRLEEEGKLKPPTGLDKAAQLPAKALKVGADIALERPAAIAVAAYHDPDGVSGKTVKQAAEALKGIPTAIGETIKDPVGTVRKAASSMEARADESFSETVNRIREEGALEDVADVATVVPAGGVAAKLVTRGAPRGGERPAKRSTGGEAKPQRASYGLVAREAQRAVDKQRARVQRKRVEKAERGGKKVPVEVREAEYANRRAGRTVEVTPVLRAARAFQARRGVAARKSRGVALLKSEQARLTARARRELARLNRYERRAYYYAKALGIRTPAQARVPLTKRREDIVADREAAGTQPKGGFRKQDELRTIDEILRSPSRYFTPRLGETVERLRPEFEEVGRRDPALNDEQIANRVVAQQAETLGLFRDAGESDADFRARVHRKADAAGLARPQYFPSERYDIEETPDFAAYALGGSHAMASPRQYTGKNFALGIQDTRPEVDLTGMARNVKRRHNWALVADTLERNAIRSAPGGNGPGGTVRSLKAWAREESVDPRSFMFWHPELYRTALRDAEADHEVTASSLMDDLLPETDLNDLGEEQSRAVSAAVTRALFEPDAIPSDYVNRSGWFIVPRAAGEEIMAATKPSGAVGRSWDVLKSKQSRALLLAGNLPWLTFQVASNFGLAAGATRGRVIPAAFKAQLFKRYALTPEERDVWEATAGSGPQSDAANNLRIGAAADNWLVNGYRAWKKLPIWHKQPLGRGRGPEVRQVLNPLEWFAAADRAQNSFFRDAVLYDNVKQQSLRDMGQHMTRLQAAQERLAAVLTLGPEERMREIVRNADALEESADALNAWLGDYTTFTHAERKYLRRGVMFYAYLRYSLRFAFYTMPLEHPIMSGILTNLSSLYRDELEDLLGGDEELPWSLGKVIWTDDGRVKEIDLNKANPAMNQLTSMTAPTQVYGLLPPIFASAVDQLHSAVNFRGGKAWRVEGKPANPFRDFDEYGLGLRARIYADDLLSTLFPYRLGETLQQDGPQGDDSTLDVSGVPGVRDLPLVRGFGERETAYSTRTREGQLRNRAIEREKAFEMTAEDFITEILPLLPQPSRAIEAAADQRAIDRERNRDKSRTRRPKYFGATPSGRRDYFGATR